VARKPEAQWVSPLRETGTDEIQMGESAVDGDSLNANPEQPILGPAQSEGELHEDAGPE
jgi:hypothetical protein